MPVNIKNIYLHNDPDFYNRVSTSDANLGTSNDEIDNNAMYMDLATAETGEKDSTGGKINTLIKNEHSTENILFNSDYYYSARSGSNLFGPNEIDLYGHRYRFGLMNPYDTISTMREYLFFTKPDLHIVQMSDDGIIEGEMLNERLEGIASWEMLLESKKITLAQLQDSYGQQLTPDRFNNILGNSCISNLEVPSLTSTMVDTPVNSFGVGYSYRGSSEDSDDGPEFSLEFRDTNRLEVYEFFKYYEKYETLKSHGLVAPCKYYTLNREIHDAFSIYKFLVGEDMETIIYYGKMFGVTPTTLPRDAFNTTQLDNGFTFSINFKAAFYDELETYILNDFNDLSYNYYYRLPYEVPVYNTTLGHVDTRPARSAYVEAVRDPYGIKPIKYKLKWRTD